MVSNLNIIRKIFEGVMRKILLLSVVLFSTGIFAQQVLTLEKSISIALQRNTGLIKSKNSIKVNEAGVKNAYGELLPSLSVGTGFTWNREENDENSFKLGAGGKLEEVGPTKSEGRSYKVGASSSITLFDGLANIRNISKANKELEASQYELDKFKQDIVYETTNLFYNVIKAKKLLEVRDENVKYNKKFLEQIEEMNKLGSIPVADVYQQQVALGNAEFQLIQAQQDYDLKKNEFLNYLALNVLEEYNLEENTPAIAGIEEFSDLNNLISKAMEKRADYKASQLIVSGLEDNVDIARGGLFPSLTGSFNYGTSSSNSTSSLFKNRDYSFSLNLNYPIFSNWKTEYQIQSAKVNLLNKKEDNQALERRIKIETKQAQLDLIASQKQLEVAKKNLLFAEENRKISQEKYQLGSGTIIEVLESNKNLLSAQSNNINALFEFIINKEKLQNRIGELNYKIYE